MSQVSAVIKEMIRQQLLTLHTCLVCKVLELYSDGTAKVQPCTMMQTAKGTVKQHVALDGVPILDQIRSTISVGKACVVVFAERDISAVRYAEFALPSASRHHSLSDGIIIGTIDGSGTVIPGESSAPLPSETATAKTSTNKKTNGTEVQVDVKVSRQSGNKLQAKSDGLFVPESPDTNTTYNISKDGSTLKLTGSDGSESSVAIPESKNTTYRVSSGIFPSSHGVTLRGSDGSNSIAPLETYRRSLYLPDATAKNMNRVTERGYLFSTHGYAFKLTMSRYDSSHNFEMDGTYVKDGVEYDFIIRGDISVKQDVTTISNLSIDCNDPDNQLSVYAYNIFEPATETHDYVYYCAWIALYSNKDLSDWTCSVLVSIHYTDGEYIEPSTPPDSEHSVDYVKMEEQVVKTADENTKYELSKTGSTITLTGSDGTSSSVLDSDTTYELSLPTYANQKEPPVPMLSMNGSDGSRNEQAIPYAYTVLKDIEYEEFSGYEFGGNYRSIADLAYVIPYSKPIEIDPCIITADLYLETKMSDGYFSGSAYCFEHTESGSTIRRMLDNAEAYSGDFAETKDWAVLDDEMMLSNPKRLVHIIRIGVANEVFNRLTGGGCSRSRLMYHTSRDGAIARPISYYSDISIDASSQTKSHSVYSLTKTDVKNVAFTGDYNDLSNKPTIPDISGKQDKSTAVTHTANTAVGSATKPVYIAANGAATPISHSINADVPANAKFTDTTYSDATQSTHGLMTAADKKKLDGMDLTKYLPLSGGVMTGDIDIVANQKELLVGSRPTANDVYATPVVSGFVHKADTMTNATPSLRSYIGSYRNTSLNRDYLLVSVRHRNGYQRDGGDGNSYGMMIYSELTSDGNLYWNKQTGKDKWMGERMLLDSANYSSYAAKSDHTHAMITNSALWVSGANNTAKWVRIGTLVSSGNFSNGVIRVWTGNGANGNANQNSSFEIQIKDGWQSTESAVKACGVTVYRINCSTVKVKVIPTAHNTYVVWAYLPWGYWNGNFEVRGKYKSWTSQHLIQSEEPEGTGADTAYYDQAFLTSTVAKATEATVLTETAWTDVPETNISPRYGKNIKYLKSGNTVYVRGSISFSASLNNPCCGTMPSELLPDDYQDHVFTAWNLKGGVPTAYPVVLGTDGKIILMNPTSTANWFVAGRAYNFNFNYHIG